MLKPLTLAMPKAKPLDPSKPWTAKEYLEQVQVIKEMKCPEKMDEFEWESVQVRMITIQSSMMQAYAMLKISESLERIEKSLGTQSKTPKTRRKTADKSTSG